MKIIVFGIFLLLFSACVHQAPDNDDDKQGQAVTPVQVISPEIGAMTDYIELNANAVVYGLYRI